MRNTWRWMMVWAAIGGFGWTAHAEEPGDLVEATRSTLGQWVETQQVISKERKDWELGREVLDQRIALLEGEVGDLQARIRQTDEEIGRTDQERRKLIRATDSMGEAMATLSRRIVTLEERTRLLLRQLPDPVRDRIKPLSQRIPERGSETRATLGERYQNVVGVLNEVNKFNQNITVTSEIRPLPDRPEVTAEVRAVYVGVGQAYYVTADGQSAGVGRPSVDGWQWEARNDIAPRVTQVLSILESGGIPAYVPLPVVVR